MVLGKTEKKIIYLMFYESPLPESSIRRDLGRKSNVYREINRLIEKGYIEAKTLKKNGKRHFMITKKSANIINNSFNFVEDKLENIKELKKWLKKIE